MSDESISGPQRVAAFLLSLEPEKAEAVLRSMSEEDVVAVADAMTKLDARLSEAGKVEELYLELAKHMNGPKVVRPADANQLESLLKGSLGEEEGVQLLKDMEDARLKGRPFMEVQLYPADAIARTLTMESAAACAVVLAGLETDQASAVLKCMDPEKATEIVKRMATLTPPPASVQRAMAEDLCSRLEASAEDGDSGVDPAERLERIASLLNSASPEMERGVLESISESDEAMAVELKELMFTWNDIAKIDKRSMQKILGAVDTKTLSVALKGAIPAVEENILGNLSERVRDMVAEERELAGPMPLTTVNDSREEIMKAIRAMIEAGEFTPSRDGEELVS